MSCRYVGQLCRIPADSLGTLDRSECVKYSIGALPSKRQYPIESFYADNYRLTANGRLGCQRNFVHGLLLTARPPPLCCPHIPVARISGVVGHTEPGHFSHGPALFCNSCFPFFTRPAADSPAAVLARPVVSDVAQGEQSSAPSEKQTTVADGLPGHCFPGIVTTPRGDGGRKFGTGTGCVSATLARHE